VHGHAGALPPKLDGDGLPDADARTRDERAKSFQ
jgi:hypothetical protein